MGTAKALRKLMDAGHDGARLLRSESKFVDDGRRSVLVRLADQRLASVEQLRGVGGRPGAVGESSSWLELLREGGRSLQVAAGGANSGDAVAACRRAMSRLEAAYDRFMSLPWPQATRDLLLEQRQGVAYASDQLVSIQF
jgi:hypothetical protein